MSSQKNGEKHYLKNTGNDIVIFGIHEVAQVQSEQFNVARLSDFIHKWKEYLDKPHRGMFKNICIILKGSVKYHCDDKTYNVIAPAIFMSRQGNVHYWTDLTEDLEGFIIQHTREYLIEHFPILTQSILEKTPFFCAGSNRNSHFIVKPPEEHMNHIGRIGETMLSEYMYRNESFRFEKAGLCLFGLYIEMHRALMKQLNPLERILSTNLQDKMNQFQKLVDVHFREIKSPSQYANLMFISPKYLNKVVKVQTGKTPKNIIMKQIVVEAKRLLRHTNWTCAGIANHLGFEDTSYFCRVFKREVGMAAHEYKLSCHPDSSSSAAHPIAEFYKVEA